MLRIPPRLEGDAEVMQDSRPLKPPSLLEKGGKSLSTKSPPVFPLALQRVTWENQQVPEHPPAAPDFARAPAQGKGVSGILNAPLLPVGQLALTRDPHPSPVQHHQGRLATNHRRLLPIRLRRSGSARGSFSRSRSFFSFCETNSTQKEKTASEELSLPSMAPTTPGSEKSPPIVATRVQRCWSKAPHTSRVADARRRRRRRHSSCFFTILFDLKNSQCRVKLLPSYYSDIKL